MPRQSTVHPATPPTLEAAPRPLIDRLCDAIDVLDEDAEQAEGTREFGEWCITMARAQEEHTEQSLRLAVEKPDFQPLRFVDTLLVNAFAKAGDWSKLQKAGATDAEIHAKLGGWPAFVPHHAKPGVWFSCGHVQYSTSRLPKPLQPLHDLRLVIGMPHSRHIGTHLFELKGQAVLDAARKLLDIPKSTKPTPAPKKAAPKKPAVKPKAPPAKKPAAPAPAKKEPPLPTMKPAAKAKVTSKQTIAQWTASVKALAKSRDVPTPALELAPSLEAWHKAGWTPTKAVDELQRIHNAAAGIVKEADEQLAEATVDAVAGRMPGAPKPGYTAHGVSTPPEPRLVARSPAVHTLEELGVDEHTLKEAVDGVMLKSGLLKRVVVTPKPVNGTDRWAYLGMTSADGSHVLYPLIPKARWSGELKTVKKVVALNPGARLMALDLAGCEVADAVEGAEYVMGPIANRLTVAKGADGAR